MVGMPFADGFASISPSKEDKLYMKAHWSHTLDMKVFGPWNLV